MKKISNAYFAGIFDGEGTVTLAKTPSSPSTYEIRAEVTNTNEWICQQLRFSFGGSITFRKAYGNNKPQYRWYTTSRNAKQFLSTILPYTHLKRPQVELALRFASHKTKGGHKSQEYLDFEKDFKNLILVMNKRGNKEKA